MCNFYFINIISTAVDASLLGPESDINGPTQTYIVAQNPEVLAHLMKENESRGLSPAAYTTPASVFNTVAVDFQKTDGAPDPVLVTQPIPIQKLQTLDPEVPEDAAADVNKKAISTLERSTSKSSTGSGTPRMGSLERANSASSPKMNSLERNISSHSSLEKCGVFSPKLGSLDRKSQNTSPTMGSLERKKSSAAGFSPKMGSLDRNTHLIAYEMEIPTYHPNPILYQFSDNTKEMQHFEESIYDFGGADVKSCAHKQQFFVQKDPKAGQV